MEVCPHINELDVPSNLEKLKDILQQDQEHNNSEIFLQTSKDDAWICLSPSCPSILSSKDKGLENHHHQYGHNFVINAHTLEIHCLECGSEIWDLSMYERVDMQPVEEDLVPHVNVRPLRELLLKEMHILHYDVEWNRKNPHLKIITQIQPCNYISSVLYALSSVQCFEKILANIYIHSLHTIRSKGQLPVSSFIYYFSRAMFHLKADTWQDLYFEDLYESIFTHLSSCMTYEFVDIYEFFVGIIANIHYETRYLRYAGNDEQNIDLTDQIVKTNKFELFTQSLLTEDSLLNSCFSGKFLIINKCFNCTELDFSSEDFLSLNLDVFTNSDIEHVKTLRKDFGIEPKEKKKGFGGLLKSLNPFSTMKEVTIKDYLNNLFNHNLVKKNESYSCEICNQSGLADKVYKIHTLPNNLLVTINYKKAEGNKYMKLKDFLEIDMQPFISDKFCNNKTNPFHLERQDQYKYKLSALIIYSSTDPSREGYITYVRHKDNVWIRFSKFSTAYINQTEVEDIKFPYILIYNREFETGNERSNIRSQLEIMNMTRYKSEMKPVPDFWIQKAVYLHSPGHIYVSHYVCQHLRLKPSYKDVYLRKRRTYHLTVTEESLFEQDNKPSDQVAKGRPLLNPDDKKSTKSLSSHTANSIETQADDTSLVKKEFATTEELESNMYCEYQLEMVSTFLPTPIAEYIIERFCEDMDVETYKNINFSEPCGQCLKTQRRLLKRECTEKKIIMENEAKETKGQFVVAAEWIVKWKLHLCHNDEDKFMKSNFFDSFEIPGKIDNYLLFDEDTQELRKDLELSKDYFFVNGNVMQIFDHLYGCNIMIGREKKDLESEELSEAEIQQLEELKLMNDPNYTVTDEEIYAITAAEPDLGSDEEVLQSGEEDGDEDYQDNGDGTNNVQPHRKLFRAESDEIKYDQEDDEEQDKPQPQQKGQTLPPRPKLEFKEDVDEADGNENQGEDIDYGSEDREEPDQEYSIHPREPERSESKYGESKRAILQKADSPHSSRDVKFEDDNTTLDHATQDETQQTIYALQEPKVEESVDIVSDVKQFDTKISNDLAFNARNQDTDLKDEDFLRGPRIIEPPPINQDVLEGENTPQDPLIEAKELVEEAVNYGEDE